MVKHTNLAWAASISFLIFSCSESYTALSGLPDPVEVVAAASACSSAAAGTGVEVPVLDLPPFDLGAEVSEEAVALAFGAGMIKLEELETTGKPEIAKKTGGGKRREGGWFGEEMRKL